MALLKSLSWKWVAGLTFLVYLLFWFFYSSPVLSEPRLNRELFLWPTVIVLLYSYVQGWRLVKQGQVSLAQIIKLAIPLSLIAVVIPMFHSTDIFGYINRGWLQLHYGLNPYVNVVDDVTGWQYDPMFTDHWVNNPSPYGFLYVLWAKFLCWLGQGEYHTTIWVFKLSNLLIHGLTAWLLWLAAKRLDYLNVKEVLYLYLWSPLILLHHLCNGHNDIMMGFGLVAAVYWVLSSRWLWVLPTLMGAIFVKYAASVAVPFAVIGYIKQHRWKALLGGIILGGLIVAILAIPYLSDWQHIRLDAIADNAGVKRGSIHAMIHHLYKQIARGIPALEPHISIVQDVVGAILKLAVVITLGWMMRQYALQKTDPRRALIDWITWSQFLVICVASSKFYPWYLGMFFAIALLCPPHHLIRRFVIWISLFQLFSFTFLGQAHMLQFLLMIALPVGLVWWSQRRQQGVVSIL